VRFYNRPAQNLRNRKEEIAMSVILGTDRYRHEIADNTVRQCSLDGKVLLTVRRPSNCLHKL
jgi:hypothetical protein